MFLSPLMFVSMCLLPVLGVCGLSALPLSFFGIRLVRYAFFGKLCGITFGIPTLCATYCWELDYGVRAYPYKRFLRFCLNVLLPLGCFIAFIVHPSVRYGWWYGLYWCIPVIIFAFCPKNAFLTAIRGTFIAHALGSLVWCYTVPMSPDLWLALIPIVAIERLVFASGMTLVFYGLRSVKKYVSLARKEGFSCNM